MCLQPEYWNASKTDPVISVTSYTQEEKVWEREAESKMPGRTEPRAKGTSDMSEQNLESRSSPAMLSRNPASAVPSLDIHLAGRRTSECFSSLLQNYLYNKMNTSVLITFK